jgi:hypothetical protein
MSDWRPIETAPRDGTWFLTYAPGYDPRAYPGPLDFAVYDTTHREFCKAGCGFDYVTHWRPLPDPPETNRAEEADPN